MPETLNRKERERRSRSREIVEAASRVFARRGFSEATLQEIAEEAEFGKGTLYNYFESKEDLFDAVIEFHIEKIQQLAEASCTPDSRSAVSCYMEFAETLFRHLHRNLGVHSLIIREIHKPAHRSQLGNMFPRLVSVLERPIATAMERGEIKPCPARRTASLYIAMTFALFHNMMGLMPCAELPQQDIDIEEEVAEVLRVLRMSFFEGLLAEAAA